MRIMTAQNWEVWHAWDDDTYDGAPDGHSPVGCGMTQMQAIEDLVEQVTGALESRIESLRSTVRELDLCVQSQIERLKTTSPSDPSVTLRQDARGDLGSTAAISGQRTPGFGYEAGKIRAYSGVFTRPEEEPYCDFLECRCQGRMMDEPEDL